MATQPNTRFHQEQTPTIKGSSSSSSSSSSISNTNLHRIGVSFHQSGAVNSTCEMNQMPNFYGMNNVTAATGNLMFGESSCSSVTTGNSLVTTCADSLLLDSVPGLKHDDGLAVEWTEDEQYRLEDALIKFKDVPTILRYIKIAAALRDKTVRDVALRCRWMMRKRRKQEESYLGRKGNYRKDKYGESSLRTDVPLTSMPPNPITVHSFPLKQMDHNQHGKRELLSGKAKHLLGQNIQALNQINNNLLSFKLLDNIDLFCRTRDNINSITTLLNDMRGFSGKISQMQELPISIDQNLANSILPRTNL